MGKRSRDKGNSFERKVAKLIVEAAGKGFTSKDCYRTPLSGGHPYAGESDLILRRRLRLILPFCVECKHYKNWKLEHMIRHTSLVKNWHRQVLHACKQDRYHRFPMLVIRGYGGLIFASAPFDYWAAWAVKSRLVTGVGLDYKFRGQAWRVIQLKDVLKVVTKKAEAKRCSL